MRHELSIEALTAQGLNLIGLLEGHAERSRQLTGEKPETIQRTHDPRSCPEDAVSNGGQRVCPHGIAATVPRVVRISDGQIVSDGQQEVDWL